MKPHHRVVQQVHTRTRVLSPNAFGSKRIRPSPALGKADFIFGKERKRDG